MEIKANTKVMHKIMTVLMKAVPSKSPLPILDNFLIRAKGGRLTITAFDMEVAITAEVQTDTCTDGCVAVPAKIITDLMATMVNGDITMNHDDGDKYMTCKWDSGSSTLPVFDPADFPEPTEPEMKTDSLTVSLQQGFLKEAIVRTAYLAEQEASGTRPILGAINFRFDKDGGEIASSDSKTLVCVECPVQGTGTFPLPVRAAVMLKAMLADTGEVKITSDAKNALFVMGNYTLTARVIAGKYPNYGDVIKNAEKNPQELTVDKQKFLSAVRRVAVCANKASRRIAMNLTFNEMTLKGEDLGFSTTATETLSCDYDGEDITVGFTADQLLQLLLKITSEQVMMKFKSEKTATILLPVQEKDKEEPVKAVIMPSIVA